jgi:hypothetical protein
MVVVGMPFGGEPTTRHSRVRLVASAPRELQVYVMGDKSPRSKDKNKKQGTKKKAREKAARDRKQAPKLPAVGRS